RERQGNVAAATAAANARGGVCSGPPPPLTSPPLEVVKPGNAVLLEPERGGRGWRAMVDPAGRCMKFGVVDHMDHGGGPLGTLYGDRLEVVGAYDRSGIHGYQFASPTPPRSAAPPRPDG